MTAATAVLAAASAAPTTVGLTAATATASTGESATTAALWTRRAESATRRLLLRRTAHLRRGLSALPNHRRADADGLLLRCALPKGFARSILTNHGFANRRFTDRGLPLVLLRKITDLRR